jgi:hypothetical protein
MIFVESCWEIEPRVVNIAGHECVVCRDREEEERWLAKRAGLGVDTDRHKSMLKGYIL